MSKNEEGMEEFKFPDEKLAVEDVSDKLEIVVEDDTPPEDRNRAAMPKEVVEEVENDDLEEYSDKVKKRLSQLKKVYHDERREKEQATRERVEAVRFAEAQLNENRLLKQRLGEGEKIFKEEITKSNKIELDSAREKLKKAYEKGDVDEIATAQEELTDLKLKARDLDRFQPEALQAKSAGVEREAQAQTPAAPAPDPKAEAWKAKNAWFGVDEEMTALALGLHEKLVRSGVDPRSEDYYKRVNETMRKRFPENFSEATAEPGDKPVTRKAAPTVVAPVARSTAPRQVRLTPSQVALAKKLGLTTEAYAREMIRLEGTTNG